MSCSHIERVGAYRDGEVPAAERAALGAHISSCAECSAELKRLERLSLWFETAKKAAPNSQAVWRARLSERRLERLATMLTAAAAVVLVACAFALARRDTSVSSTPATSWEKVAVTHQFDSAQSAESEDPMVQILFQDPQQ